MNAKDIQNKKFETGMRGYKVEEVEDFLKKVAADFSKMERECTELDQKLEILAEQVRKYRDDEDALKEALLNAQKQSNVLMVQARDSAEKVIGEAKMKAEMIVRTAESSVSDQRKAADKIIAEANMERTKLLEEANKSTKEIHTQMLAYTEQERAALVKTREEVEAFRNKILDEYKKHIDLLKSIPKSAETDFTAGITKENITRKDEKLIDLENMVKKEMAEPVSSTVAPGTFVSADNEPFDEDIEIDMSGFNKATT